MLLGVHEDKEEADTAKRFTIVGVADASKIIGDFWNTINGEKTNINTLLDETARTLS